MTAAIASGKGFHAETARSLFTGHYSGAGRETGFDVAPDGRRFVMVKSDEGSTLQHVVVVQHWIEELKRRVSAAERTR